MIGGFNYGTEINVKGHRHGFNGDSVLREAGKKKKSLCCENNENKQDKRKT